MLLKILTWITIIYMYFLNSCSFGPSIEQVKNAIEIELKMGIPVESSLDFHSIFPPGTRKITAINIETIEIIKSKSEISKTKIIESKNNEKEIDYYPIRVHVAGLFEITTLDGFYYDGQNPMYSKKSHHLNVEIEYGLIKRSEKRWRALFLSIENRKK